MARNGSRSTPGLLSGRLGERALTIRKQRGLMLREVSERTGVSIAMLSMIEHGRSTPSIGTLHALADAYGIQMSEFLHSFIRWSHRTGTRSSAARRTRRSSAPAPVSNGGS